MRSRIVLVALALVLGFSSSAFAQLEFGVLGGINFASLSGFDDVLADEGLPLSTGSRMGMRAGVFVRTPITGTLSVQPAVLFSQKGNSFDGSYVEDGIEYFSLDATTKLDYIEVPIPLRYDVNTMGAMRPYLLFGPYVAFKTSAKGTSEVEPTQAALDLVGGDRDLLEEILQDEFGFGLENEADIEGLNGVDFGIVVGGGVELTRSLGVGVDFSFGLTDVDDDGPSVKNRSFSIFGTWTFGSR